MSHNPRFDNEQKARQHMVLHGKRRPLPQKRLNFLKESLKSCLKELENLVSEVKSALTELHTGSLDSVHASVLSQFIEAKLKEIGAKDIELEQKRRKLADFLEGKERPNKFLPYKDVLRQEMAEGLKDRAGIIRFKKFDFEQIEKLESTPAIFKEMQWTMAGGLDNPDLPDAKSQKSKNKSVGTMSKMSHVRRPHRHAGVSDYSRREANRFRHAGPRYEFKLCNVCWEPLSQEFIADFPTMETCPRCQ